MRTHSETNKVIGIVGGGQLGRMLTLAAHKLGLKVIILDPTPQSPAGLVADKQIIGSYKDEKAIEELANEVDIVTFESEFINSEALKHLAQKGKNVDPSPETLTIIKDKLNQKEYLSTHNIPTAAFLSVSTKEDIQHAAKQFGFPILLKARFDAYDGKGNAVIKTDSDIDAALEKLQGRLLYVEQFCPFVKELAVMVALDKKGNSVSYPVVETVHKNNICDLTLVPPRISEKAQKNAQLMAQKTVQHLQGAGIFGIEMFLQKDDNVLVNEIAPRVHNSGHYSIEACKTSQFEQHIRAVANLPLGETTLTVKAAVMKNILGERNGTGIAEGREVAENIPGVTIHMYGKHESRKDRKMGHITAVGESVDECLRKAEEARTLIVI